MTTQNVMSFKQWEFSMVGSEGFHRRDKVVARDAWRARQPTIDALRKENEMLKKCLIQVKELLPFHGENVGSIECHIITALKESK